MIIYIAGWIYDEINISKEYCVKSGFCTNRKHRVYISNNFHRKIWSEYLNDNEVESFREELENDKVYKKYESKYDFVYPSSLFPEDIKKIRKFQILLNETKDAEAKKKLDKEQQNIHFKKYKLLKIWKNYRS